MFFLKIKGADLYMVSDPVLQTTTLTPDKSEATLFDAAQAQEMCLQNSDLEALAADAGSQFFA